MRSTLGASAVHSAPATAIFRPIWRVQPSGVSERRISESAARTAIESHRRSLADAVVGRVASGFQFVQTVAALS
jgi:hypothetical protein